jgi:hypothetical protein
VNTWGGFWIAHSEGRWGVHQVPARKSTLLDSYSKLDKTGSKPGKKVKEPEALRMPAEVDSRSSRHDRRTPHGRGHSRGGIRQSEIAWQPNPSHT